jgi:hypothetical protein
MGVDVGESDVGSGEEKDGLEVTVGGAATGVSASLSHPTKNKTHKNPIIACSNFWRLILSPFAATLLLPNWLISNLLYAYSP